MSPLIARLKELERLRTPGEWRFDGDWGRIPTIIAADGTSIASCEKNGYPDRGGRSQAQEANATLLAAGPPSLTELAEALEQAATTFQVYADLHTAKGTPEGNAKAQNNADLANMCHTALANLARRLGVEHGR